MKPLQTALAALILAVAAHAGNLPPVQTVFVILLENHNWSDFKGSVDARRSYSEGIGKASNKKMRRQLWDDLLNNLACDLVRHRPNRTEPRAVKRRPKPHPLLNQPRRKFVEISHRSRYWKGRPRNFRGLN